MGKNPIVPFILIFSLGIGLIFFMSLYGLDQQKEIADGESDEVTDVAEFDAAAFAQAKCITCHGEGLEGNGAPKLVGTDLSKEELMDIIKNGKIEAGMPSFPEADSEQLADYILSLE